MKDKRTNKNRLLFHFTVGIMFISILFATIASAALNSELQITGDAVLIPDIAFSCDNPNNAELFACIIINNHGGSNVIINRGLPDFTVAANNTNRAEEEGLWRIQDEHGDAYIFRGTHDLNNNVIFAGHQWKILRVEGNNNVRLIYNGICPNDTCVINGPLAGTPTTIGTSAFNTASQSNRYVGYMFGSSCTTYAQCHANEIYSAIKQRVNLFFDSLSENARDRIATNTFCSDRNLVTGTGIGQAQTTFGAVTRMNNREPSLNCIQPNDRLNLNVGLITIDEIIMAGGRVGTANTDFFLRSNLWYWTMSPHSTNAMGHATLYRLENLGGISAPNVVNHGGIRPVISLNYNVVVLRGNGSATAPFVIYVPAKSATCNLIAFQNCWMGTSCFMDYCSHMEGSCETPDFAFECSYCRFICSEEVSHCAEISNCEITYYPID